MNEAASLDGHAVQSQEATPSEAWEIAGLLTRAGVDHASALWFQLLEQATQRACDWSERSFAAGANLGPRAAALLGLRSLAGDILVAGRAQSEAARDAAAACLTACCETENKTPSPPLRRRRWGEGSAPCPPERTGLLQLAVGCC